MKAQVKVVGPLQTNAYLLSDEETGECAVIDPGAAGDEIADAIEQAGLKLRYILVTHGHGDHTGGAADLQRRAGGQFVAGEGDQDQIEHPWPQLVAMLPGFVNPPPIDIALQGGEILDLGRGRIVVIAVPGHTPGSMCYLAEHRVFTGDTLFKGSIGRYDLPGGDGKQELQSIRDNLLTLPDQLQVLPGHGPSTTIGEERRTNPFLKGLSEQG